MFSTLRNAWKIADLRRRMLFTLGMLIIYRLGAHIPVPRINRAAIAQLFSRGDLFSFLDTISGGALKNFSIFAMTVGPYITASIILQLLTVVIPRLEELAKEGEEGRKKMNQYTRYLTIGLAMLQGFATAYGLGQSGAVVQRGFIAYTVIALTLTAGTAFLMWLGELITDKGIGNGISLIIFSGIVSRMPAGAYNIGRLVYYKQAPILGAIAFLILALATVVGVIYVQEGQRRIPVQYAKRVVGRRVYGGQTTHIPLRVNQAGVMPIIFASSLLMFPQTVVQFINADWARSIERTFRWGGWLHTVLYVLLILFFSYFYTAIQFNPMEIANNMKKHGGFVPGIRPGKPTIDFLSKVMDRITLAGSIFLCVLVVLPILLIQLTKVSTSFGSTTVLIAVGVALETMKQIEAQVMMRHYQGFLK